MMYRYYKLFDGNIGCIIMSKMRVINILVVLLIKKKNIG